MQAKEWKKGREQSERHSQSYAMRRIVNVDDAELYERLGVGQETLIIIVVCHVAEVFQLFTVPDDRSQESPLYGKHSRLLHFQLHVSGRYFRFHCLV